MHQLKTIKCLIYSSKLRQKKYVINLSAVLYVIPGNTVCTISCFYSNITNTILQNLNCAKITKKKIYT